MSINLPHTQSNAERWSFLEVISSETLILEKSLKEHPSTGLMPQFTGSFELIINQGGIQNRKTPLREKELFKREILPWLMELSKSDEKLSGRLEIHFTEGVMKAAKLNLKN